MQDFDPRPDSVNADVGSEVNRFRIDAPLVYERDFLFIKGESR